MNFEMTYIPAILLTGMVYLFVFAGLWKNDIRKVYSIRTKREKFLTIGILGVSVVGMLFIASRQSVELPVIGMYSNVVHEMLLWFLNGSTEILAMAVYFVCTIPVMVVSAVIIDEFAQKNTALALPFYYYVMLFMVTSLCYEPLRIPVTGWFVLLLLSTACYCKVKALHEGTNKKKRLLSTFLVVGILLVFLVERAVPIMLMVEYLLLLALNIGVALVINRASVLKKKIWYIVTMVCYVLVFLVGRLF